MTEPAQTVAAVNRARAARNMVAAEKSKINIGTDRKMVAAKTAASMEQLPNPENKKATAATGEKTKYKRVMSKYIRLTRQCSKCKLCLAQM
jgi:hypothetical protein